jgi:hypothetical protein
MSMKMSTVLACVALTIAAATSLQAHHSFSMFDNSREEVVVGDVVRWAFNSPHTVLYLKDAKGTTWGFEGAAPPALVSRNPKIDGFTFKPGDRVTMIHCPLGDGRSGGAIGLVVTKDGTWYNPADGGCRAGASEMNWRKWLEAGYTSKAQAEAAGKK